MITIISQPSLHTPAYNEQYFIASGNNVAQPNFRYIVNILIGGEIIQRPYSARPDNNWLYSDVQRIVDSVVQNTWNSQAYQIERANNSIQKVVVGIDEEYGATPVQYNGASGTYYVWNAAYTAVDYKSYSFGTTTSAKSLTSLTSNKIYYGQKNAFLYWHRGFSTRNLLYMIIDARDSAGATIKITQIVNNFNGYSVPTNGIIYANCSPTGLQLIKTTTPTDITAETSPGLPIVPTNCAYYDVYFTDFANNVSSLVFRITVDSFCGKYEKTALNFLNRLGGYDWFVFNKIKRTPRSVKGLDYKKLPYELDSTNNYTYSLEKGDQVNYSKIRTNKLNLNSDWLTEAQATLLLDLMDSPDVKYEDALGNVYSVQITSKDYEDKKKVNDKLIQLPIECEFTYEDTRQRG